MTNSPFANPIMHVSEVPEATPVASQRGAIDARLFVLFESKNLRRALRDHDKLNLANLGDRAEQEWVISCTKVGAAKSLDPIMVHDRLVKGLPGQALFISAALAFDSLGEALPYFEITAKTAWQKIEKPLSRAESEQALRLGRVATAAAHLLGSRDAGRQYLRTSNFALGGATPLELLKTAEGEQLVLNELQTHQEGGPV
jgi:putative toxin-antitoxin system antitoxin component (TIGR02293 family)